MRLLTAFTGDLSSGLRGSIPNATHCGIIYDQDTKLPRLWHNRSAIPFVWQPAPPGTSIFMKGFDINRWADVFRGATLAPFQIQIIDVENILPFADIQLADQPANYGQMLGDLMKSMPWLPADVAQKVIQDGLRTVWLSMIGVLESRGYRVAAYSHPFWRSKSWPSADGGVRSWLHDRLFASMPLIYEWVGERSVSSYTNDVVAARVRDARRLMPCKPCYPFVTPMLDDGSRRMMSPEKFRASILTARDNGADGAVLWFDCKDSGQLTREWLPMFTQCVQPSLDLFTS